MKKTSTGGFTLIEMMITIAIAGVLLAIAVPSFRDLIINNSISTQANDFISGLALARSEAIKRGTSVRVTAAGADFGSGWTIWVDANANAAIDAGEALREHEALKTGFALVGSGFTNNAEIQYRSTGTSDSSGVFTLCYSGYTGRLISVSLTGRASVAKTASVCP
ncbi:MAG: GspH/FimT family pseudopilin [Sulfuricella sp.]|jgi:type IV fimbrial biogenesis protein FimT